MVALYINTAAIDSIMKRLFNAKQSQTIITKLFSNSSAMVNNKEQDALFLLHVESESLEAELLIVLLRLVADSCNHYENIAY